MFVESYLRDLRRDRFRPRALAHYVRRCAHRSWNAAHDRPAAVRSLALAGTVHVLVLLALAVTLALEVDGAVARAFLLGTGLWLMGGLLWMALHLGMLRLDDPPTRGLGVPNFLTLGRLLCIPAFHVFMTAEQTVLALVTFLTGGLTDVADGFVARRWGPITRLGRVFDPLVDILFNAGVAVTLTVVGMLPWWLLALILLRYVTLTFGAAWIYVFRGPVHVQPTVLGKSTGVVTVGLLLGVVLLHHLLPSNGEQILDLVHLSLGFIFAFSTVQVMVLGMNNIRRLRSGSGELSVVEGGERSKLR